MMNLKPPKSQTDSASDNGSVNKISDKQKINTLKKAVIDLREEKSQLIKQIAELTLKNNQLIKEREDIEEKHNSMMRDLQGQLTMNQSNLTQSSYLKEPNNNSSDQSKQVTKLKQELDSTITNYEARFAILQTAYKEMERDLKNKEISHQKLIKDVEEKTELNNQLKKNIEDIERDLYNKIKDLKAEKMEIQLKFKTLDKEMQQKDEELRVLHKELDDSRFKVAQLQGELEETRGKFIQYKLILHNQFLDIDCLFILRQNLFNDYIFELETAAQKFQYKASDITDLKIKDESSFFLSVKSRSREEVFIIQPNQDLKKICKSIKNFLLKAQQYQINQQHNQAQSPKNNGLLGGLMSFFGGTQSKNGSNTNSDAKQK
ncbi:unnamed protein product [Paramecium pentaurelia]|uniref:Uncharacterized protein n=1 Tax=Paramecium pentaurelia TaxID=43138 RepID=A0A8S1SUT3_9CILI|nr:unnamed protein product [Paramecium pentaurelia]